MAAGRGPGLNSIRSIDTGTSAGRFLFHTLAAVGELERDLIRERTRAGMAAARRRGKRFGRPSTLTQQQRERISRLRESGQSIRSISRTLGVSRSSVARTLSADRLSRNPLPSEASPAP